MSKTRAAQFIGSTIESFCRIATPTDLQNHEAELADVLSKYASAACKKKRRAARKFRDVASELVLSIRDQNSS